LNKLGLREPNTLAYALCDSPTGLLVFVMKALRTLGPRTNFSPEQIITFTELAWLPGPEYAMRFWAHCATHDDEEEKRLEKDRAAKKAAGQAVKPRVSITVFTGGKGPSITGSGSVGAVGATSAEGDLELTALPPPLPTEEKHKYVCPAWGNAHYNVVHTQRVAGKPGLLAWERPEVIGAGVRGLAKEILKVDKRLEPVVAVSQPEVAPLQQVVVIPASEPASGDGADGPSSPTPTPTPAKERNTPFITTEPPQADGYIRPALNKPSVSGETAVGQDSEERVASDKGKGKELEVPRDPFSEGNSPDTLVPTPPPLGKTTPSPLGKTAPAAAG
jgi:hypothetical protein